MKFSFLWKWFAKFRRSKHCVIRSHRQWIEEQYENRCLQNENFRVSAFNEALIELKNSGPRYSSLGICGNLTAINRIYSTAVMYFALNWPKHSGDVIFPVDRISIEEDQWSGNKGKLRRELLDYLIEQTSAETADNRAKA